MTLFIELVLMGVGLAMDAFAVSVCKGLGMTKLNKKQALIIGLYFGGFQALMPFVGWLLGSQFFWELASRKKSRALITGSPLSFLPSSEAK